MLPSPLALAVLILAAFRLWRLLAEDDLPPIARLRAWAVGEYWESGMAYKVTVEPGTGEMEGEPVALAEPMVEFRRPTLAHFLACPYCSGAWLSLALYAAWLSAPVPTLYAMTPFAISGAVGLIAANLGD